MLKKGTKLYAIFKHKCPKCHEGKVFEGTNPYQLKNFDKMLERCPVCNHKYELETGFFYGAMYVSYGLTIAFAVAIGVLGYLFIPNLNALGALVLITIGLVGLIPVSYRLSRVIWINLFTKYDSNASKGLDE